MAAQIARADLAKSLSCQNYDAPEICQGLLIGAIDSLVTLGIYCPDGNTSYGYIIDTWKRLLATNSEVAEVPTLVQVQEAVIELNLICAK